MKYKGETWKDYIDKLSRINSRAADEMRSYILKGHTDAEAMQYAFALADRYGNAAATLTCSFYDSVAEAAGVTVPPAEPASPPSFGEIAKTVNGTKGNSEVLANAIGRLCKRTSADTLLNNALRDGAQVAWIPSGDTCAFCFTLASRGWGYVTKKTLKKGHAEHIHANCDCTYAVRFNTTDNVEGYDPDAMREEYYAEGGINGIRRKFYAQNKDRINARKRELYNLSKNSLKLHSNRVGELMTPYSTRGIEVPEGTKIILKDARKYGDIAIGSAETFTEENVRIATVETGVEFARATIGNKAYVIRGSEKETPISYEILDKMKDEGGSLDFHCHPYIGDITPSPEDQKYFKLIQEITGQTSSKIISPDGKVALYNGYGIISQAEIANELTEDEIRTIEELFGGE